MIEYGYSQHPFGACWRDFNSSIVVKYMVDFMKHVSHCPIDIVMN